MIVDYIKRYLSGERSINQAVLAAMTERFASVTHRQFMKASSGTRQGGTYPPSAATKCVRANYGAWIGAPAEPFDPQATFKFWFGDLAELAALGLAQLAFVGTKHSIGENNAMVDVPLGSREETRRGFIDGLLYFNHDEHEALGFPSCRPRTPSWVSKDGDESLLVEFKSMSDFGFREFTEKGPDDTWGYLGQITAYQRALKLRRYVYVAVCPATGDIAEHVGTYDPRFATLADANYDAVMAGAKVGEPPDVPNAGQYGVEANGKLRMLCQYCARKKWCFDLKGCDVVTRTERGFMGRPKDVHYAVPRGGGAASPTLFDAAAIAKAVVEKDEKAKAKKAAKAKEVQS